MYGKGQSTKSLFSQLQRVIDQTDGIFNMSGDEQTGNFMPVERVAECTDIKPNPGFYFYPDYKPKHFRGGINRLIQ